MRILFAATLCLTLPSLPPSAWALEYACPDDPGFCYFDVGNDGCFDGGADAGPIDGQLEAGAFPSPLPADDELPTDPGSIICPPSVKRLDLPYGTDTDWRTALGGDIKIFAARIFYEAMFVQGQGDDAITLRSGRDIHLGHLVSVNSRNAGTPDLVLVHAERDVTIEKGIQVNRSCPNPGQCHRVEIVTIASDVSIGPKAKLAGSIIEIESAGGITFGSKVRVKAFDFGGIRLEATGALALTNPKIESDGAFRSNTQGVSIDGVATVKIRQDGGSNEWDAGAGDFVAETLRLDAERVVIRGQSIQIGSAAAKRSKLTARESNVEVTAGDEISIANTEIVLRGVVHHDVSLVQAGTALSLTNSRVEGPSLGDATTTVETGAGSTCDFTGTEFSSMALIHDCDTRDRSVSSRLIC